MARRTLGKNLAALLGPVSGVKAEINSFEAAENAAESLTLPASEVATPWREIAIHQISPGSMQPRRHMDEENLQALAASIRAQGIIQPLVVRAKEKGYELIAGERRWRAAQLAGLKKVPAIIREDDEKTATVVALIENIQREDLNVLDQGEAVFRLIHEFNLTHQQIGDELGMSRAAISNLLRLLQLPETVKAHLTAGRLDMGHARALLSLPTPEAQTHAAHNVMTRQFSVRQTENWVKKFQESLAEQALRDKDQAATTLKADVLEKEADFSEILAQLEHIGKATSLKCQLKSKKKGGKLVLTYKNIEQLKLFLKQWMSV